MQTGDIDLLLVAPRHFGASLFPINEWSISVHVARPLIDHPDSLPTQSGIGIVMDQAHRWNEWLTDADSVQVLAPEGYDDDVAMTRTRALHEVMSRSFPEHRVKTASPAVYQDSTGLTHCRIASKNNDVTLGWVVLSHFGELATVQDCNDAVLLAKILRLLEHLELKYIDYDYLVNRTYDGKCRSLVGQSWANRYFALAAKLNPEASGGN